MGGKVDDRPADQQPVIVVPSNTGVRGHINPPSANAPASPAGTGPRGRITAQPLDATPGPDLQPSSAAHSMPIANPADHILTITQGPLNMNSRQVAALSLLLTDAGYSRADQPLPTGGRDAQWTPNLGSALSRAAADFGVDAGTLRQGPGSPAYDSFKEDVLRGGALRAQWKMDHKVEVQLGGTGPSAAELVNAEKLGANIKGGFTFNVSGGHTLGEVSKAVQAANIRHDAGAPAHDATSSAPPAVTNDKPLTPQNQVQK